MSNTLVAIGIGSNLDNPLLHVMAAIDDLLAAQLTDLKVSTIYCSQPMGPQDQPLYINAVVTCRVTMSAHALLDVLQAIENKHGRMRVGERWGPRTLDLDVLLFGGQVIKTDKLRVPHAGIAEREFVMIPLLELLPEQHIPGHGLVKVISEQFLQHDMEGILCWIPSSKGE